MTGDQHTDHVSIGQRVSLPVAIGNSLPTLLHFLFYSQIVWFYNGVRECLGISPPHIFLIQFSANTPKENTDNKTDFLRILTNNKF